LIIPFYTFLDKTKYGKASLSTWRKKQGKKIVREALRQEKGEIHLRRRCWKGKKGKNSEAMKEAPS